MCYYIDMPPYKTCLNCDGKTHIKSITGLCRPCWEKKRRADSPYINGQKEYVKGGSQWKNKYGQTHYELNKEDYIKKAIKHKEAARKRFKDYKKTLRCVDCNNGDFRVLEFDHIRGKKEFMISIGVNQESYGWKRIMKEIKKCDPVCANCHRIRTWERRQLSISL